MCMIIRNNTNQNIILFFLEQKYLIKRNSYLNIDAKYASEKIIIMPVQKSSLRFFIVGALIEGFFDTSFIIPRQVCGLEFVIDNDFLQPPVEIDIYDNNYIISGKEHKFCPIELISVAAFIGNCSPKNVNYFLIDNKKLRNRFLLSQLLLSSGVIMLMRLLFFGNNSNLTFLIPFVIILLLCLLFIPTITSIYKFTKFCTNGNCNKVLKSNYNSGKENQSGDSVSCSEDCTGDGSKPL